MTESVTTSPRLERPLEAPFRGVCSAVARTTGTDPVLWRVLVVVLTLFNGLGIALYVAGVIGIRREGEPQSLAEKLLNGPDRRLNAEQVVLLLIGIVVVGGFLGDPSAPVVLGVAALVGLVLWRQRHEGLAPLPTAPRPATVDLEKPEPAWTPLPPLPPLPRKPRSPLGGITASVAAVVAGVLVLLGVSGTSVPTEVVLASALGVVGLGLVAGSFFGRSWGLVLLATALGLALAATLAVRPIVDDGVGDRTWSPTGSSSYRLGVGEATLDLSGVTESSTVSGRLEIGHLLVLVPEGYGVDLSARAKVGDVKVFGTERDGRKPAQDVVVAAATGKPTITLDLFVRTGYLEVRRG